MGGVSPIHPSHAEPTRPALRLVGARPPTANEMSRRSVRLENERSAGLDAHDARRIMATRTAEALEGGRAAILRPERRRVLVDLAQRMGLRAFDASLIIAIVQDGARRGEPAAHPETTDRLRLVGASARPKPSPTLSIIAAIAVALGIAGMIIAWLTGGL